MYRKNINFLSNNSLFSHMQWRSNGQWMVRIIFSSTEWLTGSRDLKRNIGFTASLSRFRCSSVFGYTSYKQEKKNSTWRIGIGNKQDKKYYLTNIIATSLLMKYVSSCGTLHNSSSDHLFPSADITLHTLQSCCCCFKEKGKHN